MLDATAYPRITIVAPLSAAAFRHSRQSVGLGDSGAAVAAATAAPVLARPSPSSLIVEFDCDAISVAPHAVRIPSTAVFRPSITCGIRRPSRSGRIGNVPLHCGHATMCPTPEMGFPPRVAVGFPSRTLPPCDVVSPTQIMLRDTRPSLSAFCLNFSMAVQLWIAACKLTVIYVSNSRIDYGGVTAHFD